MLSKFKLFVFFLVCTSSFVFIEAAGAEVFYAQDEAMEIAFPDADDIQTETFVIGESEKQIIEKKARAKLNSKIVTFFVGRKNGIVTGYAIIDSSLVRTTTATYMCILNTDGSIKSTIILAFNEPIDYIVSERWLEQFNEKTLDSSLRPGSDIHGVVGSTLSVNAITKGVRRSLALYEVLIDKR